MAETTESNRLCDVLVGESAVHNRHSRDKVAIAAGQTLFIGEVVGRITAGGEITAINFSASDGSENAAGIMAGNYDAGAAGIEGVMIARQAVVREDGLIWPAGATSQQIAGALAQLEDKGIVARESA
jgi:hypothetical protein